MFLVDPPDQVLVRGCVPRCGHLHWLGVDSERYFARALESGHLGLWNQSDMGTPDQDCLYPERFGSDDFDRRTARLLNAALNLIRVRLELNLPQSYPVVSMLQCSRLL